MKLHLRLATLLALAVGFQATSARAVYGPLPPSSTPPMTWYADYAEAYEAAQLQRKMLFIFFYSEGDAAAEAFESRSLSPADIRRDLQHYVCVKLPLEAEVVVDGEPIRLLEHPSFAEMQGRQGIAVVDLENEETSEYGHVVSTFPFSRGHYYQAPALSVILDLPRGTLTQRTLIYAVRTHPEKPASAWGTTHPVLLQAAEQQSRHQASIQNQGHHNWESRFHQINSRLPENASAQEVVAESWPGEDLVEAAVECVNSWRQSSGHWGAVRARHRYFGYDMKRGANGIWYATGIFARP